MTFIITSGYLGNNLPVHRIPALLANGRKKGGQEKVGPSVRISPPTSTARPTPEMTTAQGLMSRISGRGTDQPKRSHHQQLLFIFFFAISRPALLLCSRFSCPAN